MNLNNHFKRGIAKLYHIGAVLHNVVSGSSQTFPNILSGRQHCASSVDVNTNNYICSNRKGAEKCPFLLVIVYDIYILHLCSSHTHTWIAWGLYIHNSLKPHLLLSTALSTSIILLNVVFFKRSQIHGLFCIFHLTTVVSLFSSQCVFTQASSVWKGIDFFDYTSQGCWAKMFTAALSVGI